LRRSAQGAIWRVGPRMGPHKQKGSCSGAHG